MVLNRRFCVSGGMMSGGVMGVWVRGGGGGGGVGGGGGGGGGGRAPELFLRISKSRYQL